jgi:hypothetical protein
MENNEAAKITVDEIEDDITKAVRISEDKISTLKLKLKEEVNLNMFLRSIQTKAKQLSENINAE